MDPANGSNSYFNKFPDGPDLCIRMTHSVKPFLPEGARCTIINNPQYAQMDLRQPRRIKNLSLKLTKISLN